jgi:hypothetical protein
MAHTKGTIADKVMGVHKQWKNYDKRRAEEAHEMAKKKGGKGKKQSTFFSDTGEAHGKGHRISDTERNRKRWKKETRPKGGWTN